MHGEAGVGKTRLVTDFLSGLPTAQRVRARANSYEGATPYALVAELVRRMFGISPADTEDAARAALAGRLGRMTADGATALLLEILGYAVVSQLDPEGKRRLVIALLRQVIRDRGRERPLVVVIEDLHWTDPTSAEVLTEVAGVVPAERCLLLSTARDAAAARWPADAIALEALDSRAAEQLIDRVAAAPIDPATRALILERTAGNPFFIEEVVRSLKDGAVASVPATVQDLLEARLDALESSPRRVAHAGAVIGRTFWERVVARVTPDLDVAPALGTLTAERLVNETARTPEHTYSFAHALVQEVAYRTQLMTNRRRTHVTVGDAYASLFEERVDEFVDTLAFHYRRGDDDPKARTWLLRAGHRAQQLYANAEAVDYFSAAIERSAEDPAARADAQEALGDVAGVLGRYDEALDRYAAAATAVGAGSAVPRARLQRKTAVVHQRRGRIDEALALIAAALVDLPAGASAERGRVLLAAADMSFRAGRHDDALRQLADARQEAERAGDDAGLAEALKQLGTVHGYRGDLAEALRYQVESLAAYERVGDLLGKANVQNNIGRTERRRSRHDAALDAYRDALAIRERIGDQLGRVHSHGNIAEIHFLRGELEDAQREYEMVRELSASIGYAFGISAAQVGLGATKVARGEVTEAITDLEMAIAEFERAGQRTYTVEALRDLAATSTWKRACAAPPRSVPRCARAASRRRCTTPNTSPAR